MAGTPLSVFYANLYLKELDSYFAEKEVLYERYSDDIILFADSMQKCEKYAEFDERVRVIHKNNNGVSEARNTGIDNAIGEYIIIDAIYRIDFKQVFALLNPISRRADRLANGDAQFRFSFHI